VCFWYKGHLSQSANQPLEPSGVFAIELGGGDPFVAVEIVNQIDVGGFSQSRAEFGGSLVFDPMQLLLPLGVLPATFVAMPQIHFS